MRRASIALLLIIVAGCEGVISDPGASVDQTFHPVQPVSDGSWVPHADPGLRLLTRFEYDNTVRDLLGVDPRIATARFPADQQNSVGFDNGHTWSVSDLHVERHLEVAEAVAQLVVQTRWNDIVPCSREGEDGCVRSMLESLLPAAFRRPVAADERAVFEALAQQTADLGFESSVELVLAAVLQSPQMLYQVEPTAAQPGDTVELDDYQIASRLSYFLWASMPDEALLSAAAAGELSEPAQIEAHARRMLDDERAAQAFAQFHRNWLHLDMVAAVEKDESTFPELGPARVDELAGSMRAFIDEAFDGGLAVLTTGNSVWMTPELAAIYDVDASGATTGELVRYELDSTRRAGLLTQPGLLAMLSHADQHSPIQRGVFLRERILCAELPDPPADIATVPPEPDPDSTTRERYTVITSEGACSGCHGLINPAGFLFEHYDAIGRYRDSENGQPIDATGEIAGTSDSSLSGPISDGVELSERLSNSDTLRSCIARQWVRWALRSPETPGDEVLIEHAATVLEDSGGDFRELLVALATSDATKLRRIPEDQ